MADLDHGPETKYVWLDLEMTGLDANTDIITEVGIVITNPDLEELASYESGIKYDMAVLQPLLEANDWYLTQPDDYKAKRVQTSQGGKPLEVVEQEILNLLDEHKLSDNLVLAGNTIRADRAFIDAYWPKFATRLHYRMLDVSSFKIYFQSRYGLAHEKGNAHYALEDIRESIAELKTYSERIN